jgi:hypothetical protein
MIEKKQKCPRVKDGRWRYLMELDGDEARFVWDGRG